MAYHVYSTRGIILQGLPQNDADKYYYIFTEELGLVVASAKSVRKSESKLRYGLDDFMISDLSFIRGRHQWKITSARDRENLFTGFDLDHDKRDSAVKILQLLRKLVTGEQQHKELFTSVLESLEFLKSAHLSYFELRTFECIALLRILALLGYLQYEEKYAPFIDTSAWSSFIITDAQGLVSEMALDINSSIEASQL